jgi:RNase H-fold protein (predicted Holliday junction resolvase)
VLEGNVRRAHRKQVINHVAAALILQSFLDAARAREEAVEEASR